MAQRAARCPSRRLSSWQAAGSTAPGTTARHAASSRPPSGPPPRMPPRRAAAGRGRGPPAQKGQGQRIPGCLEGAGPGTRAMSWAWPAGDPRSAWRSHAQARPPPLPLTKSSGSSVAARHTRNAAGASLVFCRGGQGVGGGPKSGSPLPPREGQAAGSAAVAGTARPRPAAHLHHKNAGPRAGDEVPREGLWARGQQGGPGAGAPASRRRRALAGLRGLGCRAWRRKRRLGGQGRQQQQPRAAA